MPFGKMILDIRDYVQHEIFLNGVHEPATLACFLNMIREGDCIIDVGANVGQFTLAAASRVGPSGSVIAVEPYPNNCEQLLINRKLSNYCDRIEVVVAAVSGGFEITDFTIPSPFARGLCRARPASSRVEGFWIPSVGVYDVVRRFGITSAKAVKIDVEGAERSVLKSLLKSGNLRPENIIFEYIPTQFDYDEGDCNLIQFVESFGYKCFGVDGIPYEKCSIIPEGNVWAKLCNCQS